MSEPAETVARLHADCKRTADGIGGWHCPPDGKHPGRNVSAGVCRACMGQPPAKPRTTLAGLVRDHAARRAGCPSCQAAHAARLAAAHAASPAEGQKKSPTAT